MYIGLTKDLQNRLVEHNSRLNHSTKAYAPWKLLYYEVHTNDIDARRREKYLKTTSGHRAIKRMLREKFAEMNDLNNGRSTTGYA